MSEGLEALHHPRIKSARVDISAEGKHDIAYMFFDDTKQYAAIEKELEEAEENKKMLGIFKNALTVEYKPFPVEMQKESKDFVSLLCKNIATIRENELDKNLRAILKKWVLKNAFPKELKALEIIKDKRVNCFDVIDSVDYKHYLVLMEEYHKSWRLTEQEYKLLKEVLEDE